MEKWYAFVVDENECCFLRQFLLFWLFLEVKVWIWAWGTVVVWKFLFELDFELGIIEDGVDSEEADAIIDEDLDIDEDDGESVNLIGSLVFAKEIWLLLSMFRLFFLLVLKDEVESVLFDTFVFCATGGL